MGNCDCIAPLHRAMKLRKDLLVVSCEMFNRYIWPTSYYQVYFRMSDVYQVYLTDKFYFQLFRWTILCFNKIVWIKSMNFSLQNFLVIFYTWTCSNPTKILSIVVHNLCITTWLLFIMLECFIMLEYCIPFAVLLYSSFIIPLIIFVLISIWNQPLFSKSVGTIFDCFKT